MPNPGPPAIPWSAAYWQARYRGGGDSGAGSTGRLARFKAETVNRIVAENRVRSVVEFGCGDGRQLALADYPCYVGVDVSSEAVRLCSERFADDASKIFATADKDPGEADLALSLDVVFHLVEDPTFDGYMRRLFDCARRFVVIYSSDCDQPTPNAHVRHRHVSGWADRHAPGWRRVGHVRNPYPYDPGNPTETSFADFLVFASEQAGYSR